MAKQTKKSPKPSQNEKKKNEKPRRKVLRIGIVQKGRIIDEKVILKNSTITIGRGAGNTFLIPSMDLPRVYRIFEYKNKKYYLNFSKGMDGRFAINGKVYTLRQLVEDGKYVTKVKEHYQLDLSVCDRGKLVIGSITILFHFVPEPKKRPKPRIPHSMWGIYSFKKWLGGVFTAALIIFVFLWAPATIAGLRWYYKAHDLAHVKTTNKELAKKIIRRAAKAIKQQKEEIKKQEKEAGKKIKINNSAKQTAAKKKNKKNNKKNRAKGKKDNNKDKDIASNIKDKNTKQALKNINKLEKTLKGIDIPKDVPTNIPKDIPGVPPGGDVKVDIPKIDLNSAAKAAANVPTVETGPINVGGGAQVIAIEGVGKCSGPNCVSAAQAFKPGTTTEGNIDVNASIGPGGVVGGPRGGKRKGGSGRKIKIDAPKVNVANNIPKVPNVGNLNIPSGVPNTGVPKLNIGGIMKGMKAMDKPMAIMATGRVSGSLAPSCADPALKRYMYRIRARIIRCFKKAQKQTASGGGNITITYKVSTDGSLSVVALGGNLKSNVVFAQCVRGAFRGKPKSTDKGKCKTYTHKFTMILQATQ